MRRRGARDDFSPRETLSPIFASLPQQTSLSNVLINVSCFSETQAAAFLACSLHARHARRKATYAGLFRILAPKFRHTSFRNLSQKELVSGSPGGELFPCFEPLLLKSQSHTVFNALYFSSLYICLICAAARRAYASS